MKKEPSIEDKLKSLSKSDKIYIKGLVDGLLLKKQPTQDQLQTA